MKPRKFRHCAILPCGPSTDGARRCSLVFGTWYRSPTLAGIKKLITDDVSRFAFGRRGLPR